MTAAALADEIRSAARKLHRCRCGSAVTMKYDPGVTWVYCFRCEASKMALPDWQPRQLMDAWNAARAPSKP